MFSFGISSARVSPIAERVSFEFDSRNNDVASAQRKNNSLSVPFHVFHAT